MKGRELPGFEGFVLGQWPIPVLVWQTPGILKRGGKVGKQEREARWEDRVDVKGVVEKVDGRARSKL